MRHFAAVLLWASIAVSHAETVTIACGSTGAELALCRQGADAWAAKTGNTVKYVTMPGADTLSLTQQLLAAGASDIDIFQADIAWAGILGNHLLDLGQPVRLSGARHFPGMLDSVTVKGRIVGAPWFGDAGVLYVREDLLKKYGRAIPATWEELRTTAEFIQARERARDPGMWGFVWQGRAYEGLTCNALEWVAGSGGGTILDAQGNITINNPKAKEAVRRAAGWVGAITPPGVLNYTEEEARGVFQSGHAVFMRNWPYAWSLVNGAHSPVAGKVAMVALPRGSGSGDVPAATLAGSMLAVNTYSMHKTAATSLVMFLTSAAEQKRRAIQASYNPTLPSLYRDPEVLQAAPYLQTLYPTFAEAVARPSSQSGSRYNRVSVEFANAVHAVLSGEEGADERFASLERRLKRIRHGGQWK